jgi:DHA3 family macrolide efflux protein-like MFS transporter
MTRNWKRSAGFFIGGQGLSMFGSMLVQHAIIWHITLTLKSGVWMTLFTCAGLLPMVLISPFAGVWADRYSRKTIMVLADSAIALATLAMAVVFLTVGENIWLMLAVVAVRGFGQGIQAPAVSAVIPQIVPEEHLTRFNGIQSAMQSLTMFATPMLAGALMTFLPIQNIFFIDIATAVVGISVVFFFVHVEPLAQKERGQGLSAYFGEMREGLRYIATTAWLKVLLGYVAFFGVCMAPASMLTPLQVTRTFGDDVWRLTAIELLFSLGMALGGGILSVWGGFKNKTRTITMACFAFGLTTFLFGVIPNFWVYLSVMLLCGLTVPLFNTPAMTILQTRIPPQVMGRVFSILMMNNGLAMPLGMALFGPLSDAVKIEYLLMVTGALLFASGFVLCASKTLNAAGAPKEAL